MAHLQREPLHPALPARCTQLGTGAETILCNVPGSPTSHPWFLVGKSGEKSPVVPHACGIRQSGMKFGSSLGRRKGYLHTSHGQESPELRPSVGTATETQSKGRSRRDPHATLCLCGASVPLMGPLGSTPALCTPPPKGPPCFQQGAICGTAVCPRRQPRFTQLGNREQG